MVARPPIAAVKMKLTVFSRKRVTALPSQMDPMRLASAESRGAFLDINYLPNHGLVEVGVLHFITYRQQYIKSSSAAIRVLVEDEATVRRRW